MTVKVTNVDETWDEYNSGKDWHIDEEGTLHVRNQNGHHIAAHANGFWRAVTNAVA